MLRARYRLTHIGGMALGLMSVVVLVWADIDDGKGGVSAGGRYLYRVLQKQNRLLSHNVGQLLKGPKGS